MNRIIQFIQNFFLPVVAMTALLGTHFYFTFALHGIWKMLPKGIGLSVKPEEAGGRSAFSALATALAATIGTGNIVGISIAVAVGGPGAVFWCWLTGVLGMATCYAECFLSVRYRRKNGEHYIGGPMYVLEDRLKNRWLARLFAGMVILAALGMGSSVQAHSITSAVKMFTNYPSTGIGLGIALLAGIIILGGTEQITKVCTWLVPFMAVFYLTGCTVILWMNRNLLGKTIIVIVADAFALRPMVGGVLSGTMLIGMVAGISKGLFTNEAGLGSIPIAAASAKTKSAFRQGIVSMTGPFWDTVVICLITGLVIVSSMLKDPQSYGKLRADSLVFQAFSTLPFGGESMLAVALVLFAFATIIGWCYYGESAVQYLFPIKWVQGYRWIYLLGIFFGASARLDLVWKWSESFNYLMALPNLYCLWKLKKEIVSVFDENMLK